MSDRARIEWIDIAKGIGIILVVLGHSVAFGGLIHNIIFSFHMPLFFILSGYVFKSGSIKEITYKRIKTLIVPYIAFCVIGLIVTVLIPQWRRGVSLKGLIYDTYMCNPNTINVSSIWFLICLFIVTIIFNIIVRFNKYIQIISVIVCFTIGVIFSNYSYIVGILPNDRLPFNLDAALVAILFFALGKFLSNYNLNKVDIRTVAIIIEIIVLYAIAFLINGRVNLHGLTFNNPVLYIIESIGGSIVVILISMTIQKIKYISAILTWIGRKSLIILGVQAILVRLYVIVANYIDNAEYVLYGLSKIHQIICFIIVMICSLIICLLVDKIKNVNIRRING